MCKSLFSLFLVAIALNVLWLAPAAAQGEKGTIAGTVKDSSDSALQGALVEIQSLGRRIVSDSQGQFRIADLAPGEYSLTFSYVGFASLTTIARVTVAQAVTVDAVLKVASQVDQVIVTAERLQGEVEAINIERTADNIVQVLPSKVITSLPNTNVADAVGRLPSVTLERDEGEGKYVQIRGTEPRLSNVTIDGVNVPSPEATVRNIKLDVVPAGLVDRIEVNKTLSANQDADAIGGSVNLVTRTAVERATYSFGGQGGYTPIQGGRSLDEFDGTIGKRFGARKQFGALLSGTYDHNNRGIDDLEPTQAIGSFGGKNLAFVSSQDLRTYSYYRTRYGVALEGDYNPTSGTSVYLRGLYSDFHDFGETWVYAPNAGSTITGINGAQITFSPDGFMQFRHYIRRPDQQIFSFSTGARHDLSKTLITYEFAVSRSHNIGGQNFPTTHFKNGPTNVAFTEDLSNPYIPKLPVVGGTNIFDPTAFSISDTVFPHYHSTQLNFQGAASVARRYNVGSHFGTFEAGIKIRDAHKYQIEGDKLFNFTGNTPITLASVQGSFTNPSYYDKALPFGPTTDYNKILSVVQTNLAAQFTRDPTQTDIATSLGATWDTRERVYAGYLMNTIGFGKFRLQTGLRIEATDTSFLANQVNLNNGVFSSATPVTGTSGYINVLPSVQVQYLIEKNTNIRLNYGMGISRPNFSDIVPSEQVDPNTSPQTLQIGNPALTATRANNYDILVEHYFQPLGILQGGFFCKQLSNPIYPTVVKLTTGPFAGFLQQQSINEPNAHISGIEAAWEQRLSRLPGLLSGFGVSANYSYTTSQVTFPAFFSSAVKGGLGRTDHPSLQRQAPNTWNLGFTYDKSRFSMRFGVSHNDANIFAYGFVHDPANPQNDKDLMLGLKGPLGDQYLYADTQFDIQGSYSVYKGLKFVVSGLNLSNEVFGFFTGSKIYPNQREFYHPSVIAGMRWSSTSE